MCTRVLKITQDEVKVKLGSLNIRKPNFVFVIIINIKRIIKKNPRSFKTISLEL